MAQTILRRDPRHSAGLQDSGRDIRRLMREAHEAGAALVHFPEGATCSPHKRIMSVEGPDKVGPANWNRFEWSVLRQELAAITESARELGLWTVLGSVHHLTPPHRPHNSLYVISGQGEFVTRYDERMLSNTKVTHMYTPGSEPSPPRRRRTPPPTATGSAMPDLCRTVSGVPSGVVSPAGRWVTRCIEDGEPPMTIVDLDSGPRSLARLWRRTARSGVYAPHFVQDDRRSDDRRVF